MREQRIKFPYFCKRVVVVFGTSSKWVNSLKEYIPNLICYEEKSKSNYSAKVREANVIWYHDKIKKHANQDKLLAMTRKIKKEVHHFYFQGPKACAKEIVLFEEEGKVISKYY